MFGKYKALILFQLDGISTPFNEGDTLILPVTFAEDLINAGSIEKIEG
jgi:hypothetical protein